MSHMRLSLEPPGAQPCMSVWQVRLLLMRVSALNPSQASAALSAPANGWWACRSHAWAWRGRADMSLQDYFRWQQFPDNLPKDVWEPQWAHLAGTGGPAVVLGEPRPCCTAILALHGGMQKDMSEPHWARMQVTGGPAIVESKLRP